MLNAFSKTIHPKTFCYTGVWAPQVWIFCVSHRSVTESMDTFVTPLLYLTMSIMLLFLLILYGSISPKTDASLLDVPVGILTLFASVLLYIPLPFDPFLSTLLGALLGGIGMAWMYARWASFYSKLSLKTCIICFFTALIVGSSIKILTDFLSPEFDFFIICLLAVLSPLMLRLSFKHCPAPERKKPNAPLYTQASIRQLKNIAAGIMLFGLTIGIVNGMNSDIAAPLTSPTNALLHICEIALGLLAFKWGFQENKEVDFFQFWRIILVFMATALLILPFLSGDARSFALALLGVAQTIVVIFLWLALVDIAHNSKLHPYVIFGGGWILYTLPLAFGFFVGKFFPEGTDAQHVAMVLSYAIILLLVFTLKSEPRGVRKLFADLGPTIPSSENFANIDGNCVKIGDQKGLTSRETEVMQLLCKGRSKAYIAEALFISENTVRSHSKHLYMKLDVHNRQELIDLVCPIFKAE